MTDYKVIYLAPPCYGDERMWCEHDAPDDCECIDGPHPWIKYTSSQLTPDDVDANKAGGLWYRRWFKAINEGNELRALLNEAEEYVADACDAMEHSDGRDLLNRINAALEARGLEIREKGQ